VRFIAPPAKAWNKAPLALRAAGGDATTGIKSVFFFLGKPTKDNKPPEGVTAVPGTAEDDEKTVWSVKMPAPEGKKGPTEVSVQFVNPLGLSSFATAVIDLSDEDPAKSMPATISGKLLEGTRGQGGLEVILTDEKGAEKARQKTQPDGTFAFKGLAPGKYRLSATKTSSARTAVFPRVPGTFINLAAGAEEKVELVLYL
jgi:hypothetical protein